MLRPLSRVALSRLHPERGRTARRGPRRARAFHVRTSAREAIGISDDLFVLRGDLVFADLAAAERVTAAINAARAVPEAVRAIDVFAMGVAHEALHAVIARYRGERAPRALAELAPRLRDRLGGRLEATLVAFLREFSPPSVHRGEQTPEEFLAGAADGVSNVDWVLEELLLLALTNENRAYAPVGPLVSDDALRRGSAYVEVVSLAERALADAPPFGPRGETLLDFLRAPMKHAPDSIAGQLAYMKEHWGLELGALGSWERLLVATDVLAEEGRWMPRAGAPFVGEPSTAPTTFAGVMYEAEPERFSEDREWMPRVVMIAKSTFVWLDQLSKRFGRAVTTLADVPDEELAELARRGFTALWLIGVWKRSRASRAIKQRQGNGDALASAYALDGYDVADDLGGYDAYASLRDRAKRYGIRLASDMVPNHMGIDSRWVVEHPDWFIQSREPPYPGYRFEGPDLSEDARVGIVLEDGYWSHRDAAVVFERIDRATGDVRFVYHGNDGTSMPWNDTAQLDYLRGDVREAVIRTILHVARLFPIIRFDAAMTLAKRHFQRLWYPLPGSGGDCVPSRARHAMTKDDFDRAFPIEFWREVVDRVAAEAPDTLLLAEAFWMMEGYFVRTLGMHRVYNSAFMNMLKREENASYRASIRNVLEFDPRILERHVNFMNNPDEETAVAQFGSGDKYFGVATVMCTMPGLPMFGHGQIEGLSEKYGMEYRRAMHDEAPDRELVQRHEREIFPLLRRRALFSGVDRFALYDFVSEGGAVDEDVIAYSNGAGDLRVLVVFHNKYKETRGSMAASVGFKGAGGAIERRALSTELGVERGGVYVCRDYVTGNEHLFDGDVVAQTGLTLALRAFEYRVLTGFRRVTASAAVPYERLARKLDGRGVASAEEAARALRLGPVHESIVRALEPASVAYLLDERALARVEGAVREKMSYIADGVRHVFGGAARDDDLSDEAVEALILTRGSTIDRGLAVASVAFAFARGVERLRGSVDPDAATTAAFDPWRVAPVIARAFRDGGASEEDAARDAALVTLVAARSRDEPHALVARALDEVPRALGVNDHAGTRWFHRESVERLVDLLEATGIADPDVAAALHADIVASGFRVAAFQSSRGARTDARDPRVDVAKGAVGEGGVAVALFEAPILERRDV